MIWLERFNVCTCMKHSPRETGCSLFAITRSVNFAVYHMVEPFRGCHGWKILGPVPQRLHRLFIGSVLHFQRHAGAVNSTRLRWSDSEDPLPYTRRPMTHIFHLFIPLSFLTIVSAGAAETPNIIVIIADDLGYGDVSCYGTTAVQTPAIDQLAEGVRFRSGYCSASTCTPTRSRCSRARMPSGRKAPALRRRAGQLRKRGASPFLPKDEEDG